MLSYVYQLKLLCIEYIATIENSDNNQIMKELNNSFIKWLNDKLFTTSNNSLPVFGFFQYFNPLPTQSRFGNIQILLIKYLSQEGTYKQLPNIAIHLIGCWYKNYNQGKFFQNFVNDKYFFAFAVALLQGHKEKFRHL
jgi:hypothetical protein